MSEEAIVLVDLHLHLGKRFGGSLFSPGEIFHPPGFKVNTKFIPVLHCESFNFIAGEDRKSSIDRIPLINGTKRGGHYTGDPQRPETIHRLLAGTSGSKVLPGDNDVSF